MRREATGGDGETRQAQGLSEELDQRSGDIARRRALEGRPPTARGVREKGELGDHQDRAADSGEVEVHLAGLVLEQPQPGDFLRRALGNVGIVAASHADQRQETRSDPRQLLAVDFDRRPLDALQDDAQEIRPISAERESARDRDAYDTVPATPRGSTIMVNKVILVGRLGNEPEVRATANGMQVAKFNLATSRRSKAADGARKEETEWHKVVCFGKQAEIAGQYLTKGKLIYVEGRIQTSSWDDKEREGKKLYKTEIICENFQMLGSKSDGAGGGGGGRDFGGSAPAGGGNEGGGDFQDDDIPF